MIGGLSAVTLSYSGYSNDYPLKWPKSGVFRFKKKIRDEKMRGRKTAETKICVDENLPRRKNADEK